MAIFTNLFLVAYAVDAVLSLLDEVATRLWDLHGLTPLRELVAWGVLLASAAACLAALVSPRLPKRIVLPPALFILWWGLGAVSLGLFVESADARTAFALSVQTLLAGTGFALVRRRWGGWLVPRGALAEPVFRLRYTLGAVGLSLLLIPLLAGAYLPVLAAEFLTQSTGRFVSFGIGGMQIEERRYKQADAEIVLVGMMHIGAKGLYRELFTSFVGESTVVLEEGVTDYEDQLQEMLSYAPLAAAVGLGTQPAVETVLEELRAEGRVDATAWPQVWHSDVDVSELAPETIEFVRRAGRLLDAPDPGAALRSHIGWLNALVPPVRAAILHDLVIVRNDRVAENLELALRDYERVVIPWGALHMPDLEQRVLELGFERVETRRWLAASYAVMLGALWEAVGVFTLR